MLGDSKDSTNLNTSDINKHTNPSCVVWATNISIIIGRMIVWFKVHGIQRTTHINIIAPLLRDMRHALIPKH